MVGTGQGRKPRRCTDNKIFDRSAATAGFSKRSRLKGVPGKRLLLVFDFVFFTTIGTFQKTHARLLRSAFASRYYRFLFFCFVSFSPPVYSRAPGENAPYFTTGPHTVFMIIRGVLHNGRRGEGGYRARLRKRRVHHLRERSSARSPPIPSSLPRDRRRARRCRAGDACPRRAVDNTGGGGGGGPVTSVSFHHSFLLFFLSSLRFNRLRDVI